MIGLRAEINPKSTKSSGQTSKLSFIYGILFVFAKRKIGFGNIIGPPVAMI